MSAPSSPRPLRLTRAEILRRLELDEDFEVIAQSRLSPEAQTVMRRASLVRWLDAALFERVLAQPDTGVTLNELVAAGAIEPIPGAPGLHRVPDEQRVAWLRGWFPEDAPGRLPPEMAELGRELLAFFEASGEAYVIPLLYHASLVDPPRARALLTKLYDAADSTFDRARCTDLLRTVDEGRTLRVGATSLVEGDPELAALYADLSHYLDARCVWADDFYATGRTLARAALDDAFTKLLARDDRWALAIWARGGMGKTTFLRWAIARRCVPAPQRIACARLDFDHAGRGDDARAPWRAFLSFAEQLDPQLTGAPLGTLILDGRRLRDAGTREPGAAESAAALVTRFREILRFAAAGRRVLLVLDTCEEAALYAPEAFTALTAEICRLQKDLPGLRLVLSGRYDLREKMPEVCALVGEALQSVRVRGFDRKEAAQYLASRGIEAEGPAADPRATVAIRRAHGLPFKLALLADLIQLRPDITAAEIQAYPSVDLAYLIERVVERIPDAQVQWLLRYGVVPRRLTFAFVRDVLAEELPPATAGRSTTNDHGREGVPPAKQGKVFRTGPDVALPDAPDEATMRGLWDQLRQYASSSSWVTVAGPEALAFHPDVLDPMRDLLRLNSDTFVDLHRKAKAHWERRGSEAPAERAAAGREVVYHLFQIHLAEVQRAATTGAPPPGTDELERAWSAEMALATAAGDPAWQHGLAEEVTTRPFVDEEDLPSLQAPAALVAQGWIERARAALALSARLDEAAPRHVSEAERCLQALVRLPASARAGLSDIAIATLRAHLLRGRGDAPGAVAEMERAARSPAWAPRAGSLDGGLESLSVAPASRVDPLTLAHAEEAWAAALIDLGRTDAIEHAARAVRAAAEGELPRHLRRSIEKRQAEALAVCGKHVAAREVLARLGAEEPGGTERSWAILRQARVALAMNDGPSVLPDVIDLRRASTGETAVAALLVESEIQRRIGDLDEALARCDSAESAFAPLRSAKAPPPLAVRRLDAQLAETRGLVLAEALDLEPAHRCFELARTTWESAADPRAALRCRAYDITLSVVDEGDDSALAPIVERADALWGLAPQAVATLLGLYAQRAPDAFHTIAGAPFRVSLDIHALAARLDARAFPSVRVLVALAMLGFEPANIDVQQRLALALTEFDSPAGALESLTTIARVPPLPVVTPALRAALERLLPLADATGDHPTRRVLRVVEVLRVLGRTDLAAHLLGTRVSGPNGWARRLSHLRAGLSAVDRLPPEATQQVLGRFPDRVHPHALVRQSPRFGALRSAVLLEQGERLVRAGRLREAAEVVAEIATPDAQRRWPTAWRTRLAGVLAPSFEPTPGRGQGPSAPALPPDTSSPATEAMHAPGGAARTLWIDGGSQWSAAWTSGEAPRPLQAPALPEPPTLGRITRPWTRSLSEESVWRLASEWTSIARTLGQEMEDVVDASLSDRTLLGQRIDLAVRLWGARAAAIPWEMCRVPVASQVPLAFLPNLRTVFRPLPRASKRARAASQPPPGGSVLLLQPRSEVEMRGHRLSGVSHEEIYERRKLRVFRIDEPTLRDLERILFSQERLRLIHLRGILRESSDGQVVWGFQPYLTSSEDYDGREAELHPTNLGRFLEKAGHRGALVLLDPLPASSPAETVRQLLLRNRFAAELRTSPEVPPVLGMGLQPSDRWETFETLADGAGAGAPLFEVVHHLRQVLLAGRPRALTPIPSSCADEADLAVALFCDDPDTRIGDDHG